MTITVLNGNMPHYDHGLSKILRIIQDTLAELGFEMEEINLGYSQTPYYDGMKSQATDDIVHRVRQSSGVIIACTAQFYAPTAIMQTFIEYLEWDEYNDALRGKPCFLVTVSKNGGERSALEYLARVTQHLGGYDIARIGLQEIHTRALETDEAFKEIIEKEAEDFYRIVRQNRRYIIPRDYGGRQSIAGLTGADVGVLQPEKDTREKKEKLPVAEVYKRLNLDTFTERQEQDIEVLAQMFAKKYSQPELPVFEEETPAQQESPYNRPKPVKPRVKTIRQQTQSLPHYFQPQLSSGLTAVIQLSVTGAESFDGYLTITGSECEYAEGAAPAPDLCIITDSAVWQDVLKQKHTAQKAFMIGGLKVRGNFMLLTKFDTLFKLSEQ